MNLVIIITKFYINSVITLENPPRSFPVGVRKMNFSALRGFA